MIGYYDYTVVLTYANAIFGVMAIYSTLNNNIGLGIMLLVLAGICDLFDGAVANTKKNRSRAETNFGVQIDSLADLISFCVYPTVLGYALGNKDFFSMIIFSLFILAGLIRLSYFNVTEMARKEQCQSCRCHYEGLPVTSVAFIIPLIYMVSMVFNPFILGAYLIILSGIGFLFVSRIKIKKWNVAPLVEMRRKKAEARRFRNGN